MNQSNKDEKLLAEIEEERPLIEENTLQPNTRSTQSEASVSQGLAGVRKAARENKKMRFTSLLHHVSLDLLRNPACVGDIRRAEQSFAPGRNHIWPSVARSAMLSCLPGLKANGESIFFKAFVYCGVHDRNYCFGHDMRR
jgi:hypothetical protein